jgi:hypothetical protein
MIMRAADVYGWDDLVFFKVDLHGAFNLINIHPDDVWKMVCELTEGVSAVHITGSFGYTGTPAAFTVISRILNDLSNRITGGFTAWYVDDGMGIGLKDLVDSWVESITQTIESLLGPTSVEYRKVEKGRKLDWIGWEVDLDEMSVSLFNEEHRQNHLRVLHDQTQQVNSSKGHKGPSLSGNQNSHVVGPPEGVLGGHCEEHVG